MFFVLAVLGAVCAECLHTLGWALRGASALQYRLACQAPSELLVPAAGTRFNEHESSRVPRQSCRLLP